MAIQYYMNYVIFFQDQAEYEFAVSVAGGNLLEMAPRAAASLFGIPFPYPSGDMSAIPKGIYFIFPFTPGSEFLFPGSSGIFVDDNVLTKVVPGQAGNPPSIWPAGPDGVFTWSGNIVRNGAGATAGEPSPSAMPNRRWIGGRELSQNNEGLLNGENASLNRDFSRTIDGMGFGIRGNSLSNSFRQDVNTFRSALQPRTSWERFYARFRRVPSGFDVGLWRCNGFPSASAGCGIKYMQGGSVRAFGIDAINTETNEGDIFTPTLNQWYRFDILLKYGSGSQPGIIRIYINGIFTFTFSNSGSTLGANSRHTLSLLGKWNSNAERECEIDLDDWICSDLPSNMDPATLLFTDANFSLDWLLGSHVRLHTALSVSQTNWAPAAMGLGVVNQLQSPQARNGTSIVTSSTSGATLEALTDALPQDVQDGIGLVLGASCAILCYRNINAGGTDGTFGYRKAGAAAVLTSINQTNTEASQFVTYNIVNYSPMVLPDEISPWSLTHVKSADANLDTAIMMAGVVEYIGIWGEEDDPNFVFPVSRLTFLHNAPYGNSVFGYLGSQPTAPCYAVGGTYVGNGTYQEFTLPTACNMLWIRATSGTSQGCKFFSAAPTGHLGALERIIPNVRMFYEFLTGLFKFSVVGGVSSDINVNGTTYQYIAWCDPGMRFSMMGAYGHDSSSVTPKVNPLCDPSFTPLCSFFQRDLDAQGSNIEGMWFRGPGMPANQANGCNTGTTVANGANFGTGVINTFSGLHQPAMNYGAFRTADSNGACAGVMIQILQYTGNGGASQVVNLTPVSGRFPLLVCVVPTNGANPFMRDPSHLTNNSTVIGSGTNSTTAITAVAIDQITVGSALNANGVVYSVFAICGGITNVNGSFSATYCDGGGPYVPPEPPTGDINILGNGGLSLDGTTPLTLLKDISGIYTLITGKRNDTLIDRQTGQSSVDVKIPDPTFKTGYVGG